MWRFSQRRRSRPRDVPRHDELRGFRRRRRAPVQRRCGFPPGREPAGIPGLVLHRGRLLLGPRDPGTGCADGRRCSSYFTRLLCRFPDWIWRQRGSQPLKDGFLNGWHATIAMGERVVEIDGVCSVQLRGGLIYRNVVSLRPQRAADGAREEAARVLVAPRGRSPAWLGVAEEWDSNPRYLSSTHAFQACAFDRSAISPDRARRVYESGSSRAGGSLRETERGPPRARSKRSAQRAAGERSSSGEGGIRTLDTVSRIQV